MKNNFYIHFQDFVDALVGPFKTLDQCQEHIKFTEEPRE